nr:cubilin homolog isoform X2 [Parasteatoda tepidariorum]
MDIVRKENDSIEKIGNGGCNMTINTQYGYIKSPNYPNKYPRYSRCYYMIERFSKDVCEVKLTVDWFEVEKMTFTQCSEDFLEIQNGERRYKICGDLPPGSKKFVFFPLNSDQLVFQFFSTFHQKKGFSIEVKQLPFSCMNDTNKMMLASTRSSSCSQSVNSRVGRITFPDSDASIESCTYTIHRSEAQACLLQLDFTSFDVAESAGCVKDHLLLPDGQKMCGILGGTRKFVPFEAEKDEIILTFTSSDSSRSNNFDIQVTQMPGPCDGSPSPNITGTTLEGGLSTLAQNSQVETSTLAQTVSVETSTLAQTSEN